MNLQELHRINVLGVYKTTFEDLNYTPELAPHTFYVEASKGTEENFRTQV